MAVRRGRVTLNKIHEFIEDLKDLPVQIEPARSLEAWQSLVALAHQYRLTTYDAAYLELAQRTGLPLATLDRALIGAARANAVPLIEP
jgi:predicted nucleic acid-binding protein